MDMDLVEQLLHQFSPENVNFALATREFDVKRANRYNEWYKVHYAEGPISEKMRRPSAQPVSGMHTPPSLRYVPSNLTVLSASAGTKPKHLRSRGPEVWWLGHGRFPLPKATLRVKLTAS